MAIINTAAEMLALVQEDFHQHHVVRVYNSQRIRDYLDWRNTGAEDLLYICSNFMGSAINREQVVERVFRDGVARYKRVGAPDRAPATEFSFADRTRLDLDAWTMERDRTRNALREAEAQVTRLAAQATDHPPTSIAAIEEAIKSMPSVTEFAGPGGRFRDGTTAGLSLLVRFLPILYNGAQMRTYDPERYVKDTFALTTPITLKIARNGSINPVNTMHPHIAGTMCRGNGTDAMHVLAAENKPIDMIGFLATFLLGFDVRSLLNTEWPFYGWSCLRQSNGGPLGRMARRNRAELEWDGVTVRYAPTGEIGPISNWFDGAETREERVELANRGIAVSSFYPQQFLRGKSSGCLLCRGKVTKCPCTRCGDFVCDGCGQLEDACTCKRVAASEGVPNIIEMLDEEDRREGISRRPWVDIDPPQRRTQNTATTTAANADYQEADELRVDEDGNIVVDDPRPIYHEGGPR